VNVGYGEKSVEGGEEHRDVFSQVIQIAVLARIDFFRLRVLMRLSQLALSYGFAGRLMLGIMPCLRRTAT
jgi:hypothetical protein